MQEIGSTLVQALYRLEHSQIHCFRAKVAFVATLGQEL